MSSTLDSPPLKLISSEYGLKPSTSRSEPGLAVSHYSGDMLRVQDNSECSELAVAMNAEILTELESKKIQGECDRALTEIRRLRASLQRN